MKVPIEWLKQYVDTSLEADEIGVKLTEIGHMQDGKIDNKEGITVMDLEVRQNRPDVLSIIGVARELSAIVQTKLKYPDLSDLPKAKANEIKIEVESFQSCYRFNTLVIKNLSSNPLPVQMVALLTAYGMPSINPIVDISNYVMIELGQPLHAFNLDSIEGTLVVRAATHDEEFTALGGKKLKLTPDDIVIADNRGVLALAGIIGGERAKVDNKTTDILLEAAVYNQASIRRTSARHGIRTEASTRLEKFLHPKGTEVALSRALNLYSQFCSGKAVGSTDLYYNEAKELKLSFSTSQVLKIGGVKLSINEIVSILNRLELKAKKKSAQLIEVSIPYFRTDLTIEEDLIEEVLRIHGYENIPAILPNMAPPKNIQFPYVDFEMTIRNFMTACGYSEQITAPLVQENSSALLPIRLENSLTKTKDMLRTTLRHGLEQSDKNWLKYGYPRIALFEVGKIYYQSNDEYKERRTLGVILHHKSGSYFDLKGVVEVLFEKLKRRPDDSLYSIVKIDKNAFYLEFDIEALINAETVDGREVLTEPPQQIFHDFSFIVSQDQAVGAIIDALKSISPLVYQVTLGEMPKMLKGGTKSVFIHIAFSNSNNNVNISNEDVEPVRKDIVSLLESKFSARVRK